MTHGLALVRSTLPSLPAVRTERACPETTGTYALARNPQVGANWRRGNERGVNAPRTRAERGAPVPTGMNHRPTGRDANVNVRPNGALRRPQKVDDRWKTNFHPGITLKALTFALERTSGPQAGLLCGNCDGVGDGGRLRQGASGGLCPFGRGLPADRRVGGDQIEAVEHTGQAVQLGGNPGGQKPLAGAASFFV